MKKILLLLLAFSGHVLQAQQKDYPIQAVAFTQVKLSDNFWLPRIEINRTVTIPALLNVAKAQVALKIL